MTTQKNNKNFRQKNQTDDIPKSQQYKLININKLNVKYSKLSQK